MPYVLISLIEFLNATPMSTEGKRNSDYNSTNDRNKQQYVNNVYVMFWDPAVLKKVIGYT